MKQDLGELISHCIRCGFCLEACPTYGLTGSELESPRGRIYLVRSAQEGKLRWQEDVQPHLDRCLGCRACETACPSGVQYGAILELARDEVESLRPRAAKRALLELTTRPNLLRAASLFGGLGLGTIPRPVSRLLSEEQSQAQMPRPQAPRELPPLVEANLPPIRGEVYFLEGCAMRALYAGVHQCSRRLLRRAGFLVREVEQGCCGALHAHNGYGTQAAKMAIRLMTAFPEELPVIVDSAGCGSTMKSFCTISSEGEGFGRRVFDISEFLASVRFQDNLTQSSGVERRVAYHEACHLVHGQKVSSQPKSLLSAVPNLTLSPLVDADRCCGSAGIYNVLQPTLARELLDLKWQNIQLSGAELVATGNPGCHAWIEQASREHGAVVPVLHTAELLEASFVGLNALLPQPAAIRRPQGS